jgi:hypothetical protein
MKKFLLSLVTVTLLTLTSFSQDLTIFTSEFTNLDGVEFGDALKGDGGEPSRQIFSISLKDSILVHILKDESQVYKITYMDVGEDSGVPYVIFNAHSGLSGKVYTYTLINDVDEQGNDELSLFINLSVLDDLVYGGYFKVSSWVRLKTYEQ